MTVTSDKAVEALRRAGLNALAPIGIVLGSGLGSLADEVEEAVGVCREAGKHPASRAEAARILDLP